MQPTPSPLPPASHLGRESSCLQGRAKVMLVYASPRPFPGVHDLLQGHGEDDLRVCVLVVPLLAYNYPDVTSL